MNKKRKGEIALTILRHYMLEESKKLNSDFFKKGLDVAAESTGISLNELEKFIDALMEELFVKTISK